MIALFIYVYIIICICIYPYLSTINWIALCILLYHAIKYFLACQYDNMASHSRNISYQELYNIVKDGDFINTNSYSINSGFYNIIRYFNYGLAHCILIVNEKNCKYAIHSHPGTYPFNEKYIINKFKNGVDTWLIIKEPFIEFLQRSQHSIYNIYRNPLCKKKIKISDTILYTKDYPIIFYCSMFIGDILVYNGIIPNSYRYFRFRTDELLSLLIDKGYKMIPVNC